LEKLKRGRVREEGNKRQEKGQIEKEEKKGGKKGGKEEIGGGGKKEGEEKILSGFKVQSSPHWKYWISNPVLPSLELMTDEFCTSS